jgi:pilus assembly protein Flp/PilA
MLRYLRFLRDEDGTTAVEYAVLLALILLAIIASVQAVGAQSGGMWGNTKSSLDSVGFGGS